MLSLGATDALLAADTMPGWLYNTLMFIKVLIGFSIIIFVHELGHFLAAKWVGIRVDRFSVGFGTRLFGFRKGEGFTFGNRPEYSAEELTRKDYGETDYCFKVLPIGGYVKMLGQDDVVINDDTGEVSLTDDPRAFTSRPVGHRMIVVSAGVLFNLLFAALLLMAVFLVGMQMKSPVVGMVPPDSPARGKLFPGDRILEVDGSKVRSFDDIRLRAALSDGVVRLKVERDGQVLGDEIMVETTMNPEVEIRMIEIDHVMTTKLLVDGNQVDALPNLRKGDEITHVDGRPVRNALDIYDVFRNSAGRVLKFTVRRPDERDPTKFQTVECYQRATLAVAPADLTYEREGTPLDNCHVLGLCRRRLVVDVPAGKPADKAGFKRGDVIVEWGTVPNPSYGEIRESIQAQAGKPIRVVVERDGENVELTVTPKRPFRMFGGARAEVGIQFSGYGEENKAVVADVAPNTPFATLNMPRGSLLLEIDGQPISDWFDVAETLRAAAGRSVEVRYRSGSDEVSGTVDVPSSLVNELSLPPGAIVWAVDGERTVAVAGSAAGTVDMQIASNPVALRRLLASKVGQTTTLLYSPTLTEEASELSFAVRGDNTDPWQMRINYFFDVTAFSPATEPVSAHGNPLLAVKLGVNYVTYQLWQVYTFLTKLANRSMSTKNVAGPVGIIDMAIQRAKMGTAELLFFLAFLSVNLAVINFLPMPVMDGGLMLFLLIEKIKGKPLSLKTQMVSTMVGLAANALLDQLILKAPM
ncbi:MAG: site-2 protease family protein, partial [Planctomycetes bacterium]|nr:site-2 protease family protein [Planctomycetota bacterium]